MKRRRSQEPSRGRPVEQAIQSHRVLWLIEGATVRLFNCDVLSDHDAVVIDQSFAVVGDESIAVRPGADQTVSETVVENVRNVLNRRTREMRDLLAHGGVVVVRLRAPSSLTAQINSPWGRGPAGRVISWDIWAGVVDYFRALHESGIPIVEIGAGRSMVLLDPGHLLDDYLRNSGYSAVLTSLISNIDGMEILATNRGGEPTALEVQLGNGLLLLVPYDGDQAVLEGALQALLDWRSASQDDWVLPVEAAVQEEFRLAAEELAARRIAALSRLREIQAVKRDIVQRGDVQRILDYFRIATSGDTNRATCLSRLYRMVEVIEDHHGGERQMITALNLSKATVEAIKRTANRKESDVRHATIGTTSPVSDAEYMAAMQAGRRMVQAHIEHLYEQEVKARQAAPGSPN